MGGKTYIRIEAESRKNKKGQMMQWADMEPGESGREYWSEDAIRERPLEEQYPMTEDEEGHEDEYNARLQLIGEALLGAPSDETYISNGNQYHVDYETTETTPKGERTVYHGHRFEEYEPDIEGSREVYEGVFLGNGEQRRATVAQDSLPDSEYARRNPDQFPIKVSSPKIPAQQEELASHYVGELDVENKSKSDAIRGLFEHYGEERYTDEDRRRLERAKEHIAAKDSENNLRAFGIEARQFEGLFTPLVLEGLFDSTETQEHAGIIVPSEYDDVINWTDVAIALPIPIERKDGGIETIWKPIAFDLTIGTGDKKIDRIEKHFKHGHGYTEIKYPSTCTGGELASISDVPHFVICVDRGNIRRFSESVASGRPLPEDMQYIINYQITKQANAIVEYWERQEGGEEKAKEMGLLANHFTSRAEQHDFGMSVQVLDRYRNSLRYFEALGISADII